MNQLPAPALLNDLYQFTMAEGYLREGIAGRRAVFELFFRRPPHGGTFALAAGIGAALDFVERFRFQAPEIEYLRSLGLFTEGLLRKLEGLRFTGDLDAVPEGTVVFPREPILQVTAGILEAQLLETPLLNLVGFATLVATKAARVALAASPHEVMEFGCRRAQGPDGAITASRAAFVGGCASTSNLEAGRLFGIPVRGTMAHSFVMAYPSELEAFRAYARTFPGSTILLLDTFDTVQSGLPNAIIVARELAARGEKLLGVRIDSGELSAIASRVRATLDASGLKDVKIIASGDLDEGRIASLESARAPIDVYGVGTRLVASEGYCALSAVYKLVAIEGSAGTGKLLPRMKRTDDPEKATLPGKKQVLRRFEASGLACGDLLRNSDERDSDERIGGPSQPGAAPTSVPLLEPAFRTGRRVAPSLDLPEVQARARASLKSIPLEHRRLDHPLPYPVEVSEALASLRSKA